jgi:hypothetical protein
MVERSSVYRKIARNLRGRDHLEDSCVDMHIIIIIIRRRRISKE